MNQPSLLGLLFIFLGGGLGSLLRYFLGVGCCYLVPSSSAIFPWGTLLVNVLGSFLIGYLVERYHSGLGQEQFLLVVGFCGGFTTFSTFTLEVYSYFVKGLFWQGILYVVGSVLLGLTALYLGFRLSGAQ
jgi:protein CrcB